MPFPRRGANVGTLCSRIRCSNACGCHDAQASHCGFALGLQQVVGDFNLVLVCPCDNLRLPRIRIPVEATNRTVTAELAHLGNPESLANFIDQRCGDSDQFLAG